MSSPNSPSGEAKPGSSSPEDSIEGDESQDGDDLVEGMDPQGFSGPSEKVVKPLTAEALAAFKAAADRAGVVYISRIPPGMRPPKVRHLMCAYGQIGRVYLQQEGMRINPPRQIYTNDRGRCQTCVLEAEVYFYEKGAFHGRVG
jgi:ESF2/ABP1 family protein